MDEVKKENRITISMADLFRFACLLEAYGSYRDHVEAENTGLFLKSIFFSANQDVKNDFKDWAEGEVSYKENGENLQSQ